MKVKLEKGKIQNEVEKKIFLSKIGITLVIIIKVICNIMVSS